MTSAHFCYLACGVVAKSKGVEADPLPKYPCLAGGVLLATVSKLFEGGCS